MMSSSWSDKQVILSKEEEDCFKAMQYASSAVLPFALKTAVDLDLFEIIAKADPDNSMLSAAEIVSNIPAAVNPDAPSIIDRILRFLSAHSIFDCDVVTDEDGNPKRLYGVSSIGKYFLQTQDGLSFVPLLNTITDKRGIQSWHFLKDATLEGGSSFEKAFGMSLFEFAANDDNHLKNFNKLMSNHTKLIMIKALENYKGFEGISTLVDVGGGLGTNLNLILSKYPQIKAINFDLPHVVNDAPDFPGLEHVGGDMFEKIPCGEVIFLKCVLHNWDDEKCLKILRNCYDALPEHGKLILLESILPELPMTDIVSTTTFGLDVRMANALPGAKERTKKEFEKLATEARFKTFKLVCSAYNYWVIELYKH